jgi:hypothetical protein
LAAAKKSKNNGEFLVHLLEGAEFNKTFEFLDYKKAVDHVFLEG